MHFPRPRPSKKVAGPGVARVKVPRGKLSEIEKCHHVVVFYTSSDFEVNSFLIILRFSSASASLPPGRRDVHPLEELARNFGYAQVSPEGAIIFGSSGGPSGPPLIVYMTYSTRSRLEARGTPYAPQNMRNFIFLVKIPYHARFEYGGSSILRLRQTWRCGFARFCPYGSVPPSLNLCFIA